MARIPKRTKLLIVAGVAVLGLAGALFVLLMLGSHGYTLGEAGAAVLNQIRGLGAASFFLLMALLPVVGAPLSIFTLSAGPVFGPVLGLPTVLALAVLSIALNLVITYALARWLMRPWAEKICAWLGYQLPEVAAGDQRSLVILVRVTPGPPYVLQNYLLGLAGIPFATYFLISWVVSSAYACAFIIFGDALAQGRGRGALLAFSLFIALAVGLRFLRKKMTKKKPEPAKVTYD